MRNVAWCTFALAGSLVAISCYAEVKSGPEVGKSVGVFNPQHVTGSNAGQASCLV